MSSLSSSAIRPVIAVTDLQRSRDFYENVLGLDVNYIDAEHQQVVFESDLGELEIYVTDAYRGPSGTTVATLTVEDIDDVFADLKEAGVSFLEDRVFVDGNKKAAWFLDPDANYLCIHEIV